MTSSHPDLHHLITLICHEGKCKKNNKTFSPSRTIFLLRWKKRSKVERSRTKCVTAGSLPGTSCPPLILHTLFAALFTPGGACHRPAFLSRLLLHLGIQVLALNPGTVITSYGPLPGAITLRFQSNLIRYPRIAVPWPLAGPSWGPEGGEPVKCLSQIFNCVPQCDKGSACWGRKLEACSIRALY